MHVCRHPGGIAPTELEIYATCFGMATALHCRSCWLHCEGCDCSAGACPPPPPPRPPQQAAPPAMPMACPTRITKGESTSTTQPSAQLVQMCHSANACAGVCGCFLAVAACQLDRLLSMIINECCGDALSGARVTVRLVYRQSAFPPDMCMPPQLPSSLPHHYADPSWQYPPPWALVSPTPPGLRGCRVACPWHTPAAPASIACLPAVLA